MKLNIFDNGCTDAELMVLDTKLNYFLNKVSQSSTLNEVEVHILRSKEAFREVTGEELNGRCSRFLDNKVFILEPSKFPETDHKREEFFEVLYKQLFVVMYQNGN